MLTEKKVYQHLKKVIDPELGVNIVDLGLIYEVVVKSNKVTVLMTLTSPGCPLAGVFESLVQAVFEDINDFNPQKDLTVELTFDPPWTLEMMNPETRAQLGFD